MDKYWWGRQDYAVSILKHIEINVPHVQSNYGSGKGIEFLLQLKKHDKIPTNNKENAQDAVK